MCINVSPKAIVYSNFRQSSTEIVRIIVSSRNDDFTGSVNEAPLPLNMHSRAAL